MFEVLLQTSSSDIGTRGGLLQTYFKHPNTCAKRNILLGGAHRRSTCDVTSVVHLLPNNKPGLDLRNVLVPGVGSSPDGLPGLLDELLDFLSLVQSLQCLPILGL